MHPADLLVSGTPQVMGLNWCYESDYINVVYGEERNLRLANLPQTVPMCAT